MQIQEELKTWTSIIIYRTCFVFIGSVKTCSSTHRAKAGDTPCENFDKPVVISYNK